MKYLFISAHTDDCELSCGATMDKLRHYGHEIYHRTFSFIYDELNLADEWWASMGKLQISRCKMMCIKPRYFNEARQIILQDLIDIKKEINPDFVFTHSPNDTHQDHKVVGEESLRAFKHQNLITFQAEWNTLQSESNYFIEVSEDNMATKIAAMDCYKSQQHRYYFNRQFTYARALLAGAKIGVKYAEPFRIVNMKN